MTVKEIIKLQRDSGNLFLHRQGLFFRGYNETAAFLHKALGYQLKVKEIKSCGGEVFYVGFPAVSIDKIVSIVNQYGGSVEGYDISTMIISDITLSYDENTLQPEVKSQHKKRLNLANEIEAFNIMSHTPVDCMCFIADLQERLKRSLQH